MITPGEYIYEFSSLVTDTNISNFFINSYEYDLVNNFFIHANKNIYILNSGISNKYTHYIFLLDPLYFSFTLVSHTLKISDTWTYFLNKHFYNHLNDWLYLMIPKQQENLCWGQLGHIMTYINIWFDWRHDHLRKTSIWNRWIFPYEVCWNYLFFEHYYPKELEMAHSKLSNSFVLKMYNPLFTEWLHKNEYNIPNIIITTNYSWLGILKYYYYYLISKSLYILDYSNIYQVYGYKYYYKLYFEKLTFLKLIPIFIYLGCIISNILITISILFIIIRWCLRTLKQVFNTIWSKFNLNWILDEIFTEFLSDEPRYIKTIFILSHYRVLLSNLSMARDRKTYRKWNKKLYFYLVDKYSFFIFAYIKANLGQIFYVFLYSSLIYILRSICRLIFCEQYLYGIFYTFVYIMYCTLYTFKKNITKNFHKNLWKFFVILKNFLITGLYLNYPFTTIRTFSYILSYVPFYLSTKVMINHPYKHDYIFRKFFTYWLPNRYQDLNNNRIVINKKILITIIFSWISYIIIYTLFFPLKIVLFFLDKFENLFLYKFYLFIYSMSTKLMIKILSLNFFAPKKFIKTIFLITILYVYKMVITISIGIYLLYKIYYYIIHDNWKTIINLLFNYTTIIIGFCVLMSIKLCSYIIFKVVSWLMYFLLRIKIFIILYILYFLGFDLITFFDIIYYAYALWIPEQFFSAICESYLNYYFDDLWAWYRGSRTFDRHNLVFAYQNFIDSYFFQESDAYLREYDYFKQFFFDDFDKFKPWVVWEMFWNNELYYFAYDIVTLLPNIFISILYQKIILYKWFSPLSIIYMNNLSNWWNFIYIWNLILHMKFCLHLYLAILWKVLMPQYIFSKLAYIYFYHFSTITYFINKFLYISGTYNLIYLIMIYTNTLYVMVNEILIIIFEAYFAVYNIIFVRIVRYILLITDNFSYFLSIFLNLLYSLISETINLFIPFDTKSTSSKYYDIIMRTFLIFNVYSKHYLDIFFANFRISTTDILKYINNYEWSHSNPYSVYISHFEVYGFLDEYNSLVNIMLGHNLYQDYKWSKFFMLNKDIWVHSYTWTFH